MKRHVCFLTLGILISACGSESRTADPDASTADAGGGGSDGGSDGGTAQCSAARAQLLGAIDSVSTGSVAVLSNTGGVNTLYVNASAGGPANAATKPWIFINLETSSKVAVTDTTFMTSMDWDLALKRPLIFTNDGDGGPGQGGAVLISKAFDQVTAADATSATLATESFFDADCNPKLDPSGAAKTTFASWYSYNPSTHVLTPAAGTWLVRGGTGKLYKLEIQTYYATPDGGTGMAGGNYKLRVGAL